MRQQRSSLRWLPWITGAAGVATLLAAWFAPSLPRSWRIGLNLATGMFAVACAFAVQRGLSVASLAADRAGARMLDLKARAANDPKARAEYADYLDAVVEMLRGMPRPRGLPARQHAAMVESAVQRLRAEQAELNQLSGESAV